MPTPAAMYSQKMFKPLANSSSNHTAASGNPVAPSFSMPSSNPQPVHRAAQQVAHAGKRNPSLDSKNPAPLHRTPFKPSAPVQIPRSAPSKAPPDSRPPLGRSLGSAQHSLQISTSPAIPIPQSLPNLQPSYPATLFGGLSADDEHVTVWEPHTGKTVAGNAAPYRRNLGAWLEGHPGWEEKADELKSSKRRTAARRSRSAADAFAALCCYPVAPFLASDAAQRLNALGGANQCNEETMMMWTSDDFVRLQEALFRLGQECHRHSCNLGLVEANRWASVSAQVGGSKPESTIVYCAHHMLKRGIAKSQKELAEIALPGSFGAVAPPFGTNSGIGSPASVNSLDIRSTCIADPTGPSSLPTLDGGLGASFLERSFRAPREPRVTVWDPSNGRTISGNAAPCRRNLEAWMRQHPGWIPKEEGQLSSSRRNRNRKIRPSSVPSSRAAGASSVEPESPHFNDALEGLLGLSRSPSAFSPGNGDAEDAEMEDDGGSQHAGGIGGTSPRVKKHGMTSSISSSSAEDGNEDQMSEDEVEDESNRMEL